MGSCALFAAGLTACAQMAGEGRNGVQRMYVFDCGENQTNDLSRWSPGFNVGKYFEFSDQCYLIRHAKGLMLWDSGLSDSIASTPGHTPGHQSLLVRLPKRGPVVLSGDMTHFQESWVNRRIPANNFSKEQSVQSMEKVAALLEASKAQLWINHDKAQSAGIPKSPKYVE